MAARIKTAYNLTLAILSIVMGISVTTIIYLAVIDRFEPSLAPFLKVAGSTNPIILNGTRFKPLNGTKLTKNNGSAATVKTMLNGDLTLSARTNFRAHSYPFVEYKISPLNEEVSVYLFWRNSVEPEKLHYVSLDLSSLPTNQLSMAHSDDWTGNVRELTIFSLFYLRARPFTLTEVSLLPATRLNILGQIISESLSLRVWTQKSINGLASGPTNALLSPTIVFSVWAASSISIYAVCIWLTRGLRNRQRCERVARFSALVILLIWISLDILWSRRLLFQAEVTNSLFAGKKIDEKKLADIDSAIYQDAETMKSLLQNTDRMIWLVTKDPGQFSGYRFKYHLTPQPVYYYKTAAYLARMMLRFGSAKAGDFVLVVKPSPERTGFNETMGQFRLVKLCAAAEMIYESKISTLVRLKKDLERC